MEARQLMDEKAAAARLGATVSFMRRCRLFKTGPTYLKLGKLVRYSDADLDEYIEKGKVEPSTIN
jgi:hypothetical protein